MPLLKISFAREDGDSLYPFSNKHYREIFSHTLWILPGVKEAKALSKLLAEHPVFRLFRVVNVAGRGDEEIAMHKALRQVTDAIGDDSDTTYTITLSCGRLTTGGKCQAMDRRLYDGRLSYDLSCNIYANDLPRTDSLHAQWEDEDRLLCL